MQSLSPALEQQLQLIWGCFSRPIDGVQSIALPELTLFLTALNRGAPPPSLLCSQLLNRYSGTNGTIVYPSFARLVCNETLPGLVGGSRESAEAVTEDLARAFSTADLDGDAFLAPSEIARLMESDGNPVSYAEVEAVMEEAGVSKGAKGMTLEQFLELCVNTQVL